MSKNYWVGIDTGGTFTDLVLVDPATRQCVFHKVPTKTADPSRGVLEGIGELLELAQAPASEVGFLVLGTTLATNAVLEGKWARTGMVTTKGFRDVLDIARQRRPHYFNLDIPKPAPPALREHRVEVAGRMAFDGQELEALDEQGVADAIDSLKQSGVEAVAICFMHAYANEEHERRALAIARERWPGVYLCTSASVLPEFREYERFVTTAVNASLMPIMDRYLERFEQGVKALGVPDAARVMQSNGGAVTAGSVRRLPINTFFSGPAGGVMAAVAVGEQTGIRSVITFDMGGTSTDVCLIKDGQPAMKNERAMGGMPVRTRTLDIHTIGAGGGSIAWIDKGGLLKVGPKSAGASPGPAAYGRGGVLPTVTDANVLLGRLSPVSLLDGRMRVFPEQAAGAIRQELCDALGFDDVVAAVGVLEIANVHMTGAVRVISVEQGEDPRDYTLIAFGGAGPLHAADVALAAGMRRVLVPPRPGLLSAQGLLQSDQRGDFSMTRLVGAVDSQLDNLNAGLAELARRVDEWLSAEGANEQSVVTRVWQLDLRYVGQNSELIVTTPQPSLDAASLAILCDQFHRRHAALYGYDMRQQSIEIVNVRAQALIGRERIAPAQATVSGNFNEAIAGERPVWFRQTGFVDTPIVKRERLAAGTEFVGPAVIEQMDTTTVVPPDARVSVDAFGYLHIDLSAVSAEGGL